MLRTESISSVNDSHMCSQSLTFSQIFHKYRSPLIYFAKQLVWDQFVAEDIVTEVFIKLWHREYNYETVSAKKHFLFHCTRNECVDFLRKKKYRESQLKNAAYTIDSYEQFTVNRVPYCPKTIQALNIIEGLPPVCRQIIILSYLKGLNREKIAKQLGLSSNTVRNHKAQGLKKIRERFKELELLQNN